MSARIVLFGATGYTGEGTARALVRNGQRPILAARSPERLARLAEELGGLETAVADVDHPQSVRALVERGDVLLSTVGPFTRFGAPAIEAAIDAGANYIDSTGEADFIRSVFEQYGPRAETSGSTLLTAFGYDWVPGNLAGELALREAGDAATRLAIGYFTNSGASGGTKATAIGQILSSAHILRDGKLRTEPAGARVRAFTLPGGGKSQAISTGGTEPLALPRLHPGLRDVVVHVGIESPKSKALPIVLKTLPALSRANAALLNIPGLRSGVRGVVEKRVTGSTGGPSASSRERTSATVVVVASSSDGKQLSEVALSGVNPYTFTFEILAWGAGQLAENPELAAGAFGPSEAFGVELLEQGVAAAGLLPAEAS